MPTAMFAHAASRWGSKQAENLATSALVYLLNTYEEAGRALVAVMGRLNQGSVPLEEHLRFVEQFVAAGTRIDAAGLGQGGARRVLIECKFGAVLGDSQIDGYLDELATPGSLIFIVPRQRRTETISQVCRVLDLQPTDFADQEAFMTANLGDQAVAVTDWLSVLDILEAATTDGDAAAEFGQLRSYVDLMTGDDFVALAPEELAGRVGARWWQYTQVFEEAVAAAQLKGILVTEGILAGSHGSSGRGLRIGPWLVWGGAHAGAWSDTADTPLWLNFTEGPGRPQHETVLTALRTLNSTGSDRVFERKGHVMVGLYLPSAVDRGEVVASLVTQLSEIRAAIDAFANPDPTG